MSSWACTAVVIKPAAPVRGDAPPGEAREEGGGGQAGKRHKGRKQQQQQQEQQEVQHGAKDGEGGGQWEVVDFDCEDRVGRQSAGASPLVPSCAPLRH